MKFTGGLQDVAATTAGRFCVLKRKCSVPTSNQVDKVTFLFLAF